MTCGETLFLTLAFRVETVGEVFVCLCVCDCLQTKVSLTHLILTHPQLQPWAGSLLSSYLYPFCTCT